MPAEIFYFFISELQAKVQDVCKDFGDNLGTEEDWQFLSRSFDFVQISASFLLYE